MLIVGLVDLSSINMNMLVEEVGGEVTSVTSDSPTKKKTKGGAEGKRTGSSINKKNATNDKRIVCMSRVGVGRRPNWQTKKYNTHTHTHTQTWMRNELNDTRERQDIAYIHQNTSEEGKNCDTTRLCF